jgi:hypothetical protein
MVAKAGAVRLCSRQRGRESLVFGNEHMTSSPMARINYSAEGQHRLSVRARDLHLVLGAANRKPIRFRVAIDGKPPGGSMAPMSMPTAKVS